MAQSWRHTRDVLGGDERTRTADPLLAKQVLYQLSYVPLLTCDDRNSLRRTAVAEPLTRPPPPPSEKEPSFRSWGQRRGRQREND